jgi:hypothetical protein
VACAVRYNAAEGRRSGSECCRCLLLSVIEGVDRIASELSRVGILVISVINSEKR